MVKKTSEGINKQFQEGRAELVQCSEGKQTGSCWEKFPNMPFWPRETDAKRNGEIPSLGEVPTLTDKSPGNILWGITQCGQNTGCKV